MGRMDSDPRAPSVGVGAPPRPRRTPQHQPRNTPTSQWRTPRRNSQRVVSAHPLYEQQPIEGTAAPERRRLTTTEIETVQTQTRSHARRIRREETMVVEAGTVLLDIVDVASEQAPEEAGLGTSSQMALTRVSPTPPPAKAGSSNKAVAIAGDDGDDASASLLIPGVRVSPTPPVQRKRLSGKMGFTSGIIAVVLCAVIALGVLQVVRPLIGGAQVAGSSYLTAASLAIDPNNPIPVSPFQTSAGATTTLGIGGGAGPGVNAPGSAGLPVTGATNNSKAPGATAVYGVSAAPFSPWPPSNAYMAVPGYSAFAVSYPSDGFYGWSFGQCTWWAQNKRRDENLTHMGNAQYWASGAAARGYTVSNVPRPNATVVFQPGVQGAGGAGHVAHVVAVYPNGWFLISEMNFYWNGGGWARVDFRYAHSGWGVKFIY